MNTPSPTRRQLAGLLWILLLSGLCVGICLHRGRSAASIPAPAQVQTALQQAERERYPAQTDTTRRDRQKQKNQAAEKKKESKKKKTKPRQKENRGGHNVAAPNNTKPQPRNPLTEDVTTNSALREC